MLAISAIFAVTVPLVNPAVVTRQGVDVVRTGGSNELRLSGGGTIRTTSASV